MPVQVFDLSPTESNASLIGKSIGQGINKNFPDPQMLVQRQMLQKALMDAKQAVRQPGATPLDKIFSVMEAGAGIPGSERYLGSVLPLIQQLTSAEAAQNAPFGLENGQQEPNIAQNPEEIGLSNFLDSGKQNQFFPSNEGGQEATGNLPQAATSGQKQPVLSNQQLLKYSKPYALQQTKAGNPTKPAEAYEQLKALNEDNKQANQLVETERKERVINQGIYGDKALKQVLDVYPEASPEIQAHFKKLGEDEAGKNKSEADIEHYLATEAKNFKNMITNIEKDADRENMFLNAPRALVGTYKKIEKASEDLRQHLKPLLDLGLYDTARELLAKKSFGVEEREAIINPLSEREKTYLNRVPDGKLGSQNERSNIENIKKGFVDLKQANPNFSLPLARKVFEDKNYDWRLVKDALNELRNEGFQLENDQQTMSGYLDSPPLSLVEKLLHGLNIIGR